MRAINSVFKKLKIGILEAGLLNQKVADRFEPYPLMFASFLGKAKRDLSFQAFSVVQAEMPASIHDCDGWLITGSRHGVYENLEWMLRLQAFICELAAERVPLVGICFGHQIIAQALGGEVVKSDKGWGVGLQYYHIDRRQSWMREVVPQIGIYTFHQDQVVRCPASASVFLSSAFCPYAGLNYGASIISVQAHPEFEAAYELAILDVYEGNPVPRSLTVSAREFINSGNRADSQLLAHWLAEFFLLPRSTTTGVAANSN